MRRLAGCRCSVIHRCGVMLVLRVDGDNDSAGLLRTELRPITTRCGLGLPLRFSGLSLPVGVLLT